jgi:hypothetical protein
MKSLLAGINIHRHFHTNGEMAVYIINLKSALEASLSRLDLLHTETGIDERGTSWKELQIALEPFKVAGDDAKDGV